MSQSFEIRDFQFGGERVEARAGKLAGVLQLAQQRQFVADIGKLLRVGDVLSLDFKDGDFVEQLADCAGDQEFGCRRGRLLPADGIATSLAISLKTLAQSPLAGCRNRRTVGYHGKSVRPSIQRHSGTCFKATKTGSPMAPAR